MACGIGQSCGSPAQCKTVCGPQGCKKSCAGGAQAPAAPQGGAPGAEQDPAKLVLTLLTAIIGEIAKGQGGGQQPAA